MYLPISIRLNSIEKICSSVNDWFIWKHRQHEVSPAYRKDSAKFLLNIYYYRTISYTLSSATKMRMKKKRKGKHLQQHTLNKTVSTALLGCKKRPCEIYDRKTDVRNSIRIDFPCRTRGKPRILVWWDFMVVRRWWKRLLKPYVDALRSKIMLSKWDAIRKVWWHSSTRLNNIFMENRTKTFIIIYYIRHWKKIYISLLNFQQ